ncbi:helix-turn-helix transcriptional regulator [Streptoalloteichus hindustanus]|uniref:DNA-binding transcriptional regulator, CsgD family n=1 Tax=Streptoalloteichus hindustanus TaxID=2017 RepID=A0A1M5MZG6_STRHI|nr:helix-turn-helix transcriptional regulator [Streptoalloteichus hindustanus]SHG82736.1 DNA-binding transcriptional regulator, CsgD family [Streptoalloteichus hindustanus]
MPSTRTDPTNLAPKLTSAAHDNLTSDDLGDVLSASLSVLVAHDALHLIVCNPLTGTVSFGFWHRYPQNLAYAQMRNAYLGDDPMSPTALSRRAKPFGVLDVGAPPGKREGRRAREILDQHGLGSELRVLLRDANGMWGVLCLFRERGVRFAQDETDILVALIPTLIAFVRAYVTTGSHSPATATRSPGVVLVGADHEVRGLTRQARQWMHEMRRSNWLSAPDWAAMALASETRQHDGGPRQPMICVPPAYIGRWVTMRAEPLGSDGTVAVTIQGTPGKTLLPVIAAWHGLTLRELTVTEMLCLGMAPRQIARHLNLSAHTVNDHIKAVYRKTNSSSRDQLMAAVNS